MEQFAQNFASAGLMLEQNWHCTEDIQRPPYGAGAIVRARVERGKRFAERRRRAPGHKRI